MSRKTRGVDGTGRLRARACRIPEVDTERAAATRCAAALRIEREYVDLVRLVEPENPGADAERAEARQFRSIDAVLAGRIDHCRITPRIRGRSIPFFIDV